MDIELGVDTLCYYCRLAEGEISVEDIVRECAALGADFVQVTAGHLRGWSQTRLSGLRALADGLGLGLTLGGSPLGSARSGDKPAQAAEHVSELARTATLIGSPYLVVFSGFYRSELWREPALIAREKAFVTEALRAAVECRGEGPMILVENHSDFTVDEYLEILDEVDSPQVGIFLDMINPVSSLEDPLETSRLLAPRAPAGHIKDFKMTSQHVGYGGRLRRGFEVQWCYPGEGVAEIAPLIEILTTEPGHDGYRLSIEGLDNRAGIADQRERLLPALALLRDCIAADIRKTP